MPSTYADDPNAWEKVDGQFVNSNGEVIPGAVMKGIDVSEHNGEIDWEKVKTTALISPLSAADMDRIWKARMMTIGKPM